jgi:hypothetical protein
VCTISARALVGGAINNLPSPAAAAAVKKARREGFEIALEIASTFGFSDMGRSAFGDVSSC